MGYDSEAALSPEFRRFAPLFENLDGPILDAPCGYGRHAFELQKLGCTVTCVDIDEEALTYIESQDKIFEFCSHNRIKALRHDLVNEPWPFGAGTFGGAVNVHFYNVELIKNITQAVQAGGLLYVETIANRGGNYLELPITGELRALLQLHFNFLHYKERPAGPAGSDRATVRLLGTKL